MLKQAEMFKQALIEKGLPINGLQVKHSLAINIIGNESFGIIFPKSFITLINSLNNTKIFDYNFVGKYTDKRAWVNKFNNSNSRIIYTLDGRAPDKPLFDTKYYQTMCSSRFTLCPAGDFVWTYRFLEAAACKAIPVIDKFDSKTMPLLKYYTPTDKHVYRQDWVDFNYEVFLDKCLLK